jgi:hypothetical protein
MRDGKPFSPFDFAQELGKSGFGFKGANLRVSGASGHSNLCFNIKPVCSTSLSEPIELGRGLVDACLGCLAEGEGELQWQPSDARRKSVVSCEL